MIINTLHLMHTKIYILIIGLLLISCQTNQKAPDPLEDKVIPMVNWQDKYYDFQDTDKLYRGSSYLSVYSEIYMYSGTKTYNLTATVSLKNIYPKDSVYITKASYYNTQGELIQTYVNRPIVLKPMETLEIVIGQKDTKGGSGGNFYFDWSTTKEHLEPHFEAVMISTTGQQGLSFTSQGIRIN